MWFVSIKKRLNLQKTIKLGTQLETIMGMEHFGRSVQIYFNLFKTSTEDFLN